MGIFLKNTKQFEKLWSTVRERDQKIKEVIFWICVFWCLEIPKMQISETSANFDDRDDEERSKLFKKLQNISSKLK